MSRRADLDTIRTRAAAGYLAPAAVVARYGAKHGFKLKLVYKWMAQWRREQLHVDGKVAVDDDGSNVWILRAAVVETMKARKR